ncbi:uncharacterized protein LOC124431021 [Vespa crabro]|uniref:uncharacterized protein LOC124431021 n=1 Tax=Vespa crabro TaxID=7445 RepID=UPI001F01F60A|nr:uncharacterized protein LOC124431021 [Vespa crabro]
MRAARIIARVFQRPRANTVPDVGTVKRVATSPPQFPEESLKIPRQEATTTEATKWTEVVKKKKDKEKPAKKSTKHPQQEKKKPSKSEDRPRKRTKPETASFAETLRKVVGNTSSITELVPRPTLEIRDCDYCTSLVEVEEALKRTLSDYAGKLEVKMTNPNARQQRLALVKIEEEVAAKHFKAGRMLVGFASCRVRCRADVRRCYRCLDYGHHSASCKGPDRSKFCYFCGGTRHKIKDCKDSEPTCFLYSNSVAESKKHLMGS